MVGGVRACQQRTPGKVAERDWMGGGGQVERGRRVHRLNC